MLSVHAMDHLSGKTKVRFNKYCKYYECIVVLLCVVMIMKELQTICNEEGGKHSLVRVLETMEQFYLLI